ncbi:MAG: hypothetical protein KAS12_01190 [Candidatus Aenigmarchaeota archaeon]|nr:hypothetical protein [Candidatus Aenigmarchaeota archaeon]
MHFRLFNEVDLTQKQNKKLKKRGITTFPSGVVRGQVLSGAQNIVLFISASDKRTQQRRNSEDGNIETFMMESISQEGEDDGMGEGSDREKIKSNMTALATKLTEERKAKSPTKKTNQKNGSTNVNKGINKNRMHRNNIAASKRSNQDPEAMADAFEKNLMG